MDKVINQLSHPDGCCPHFHNFFMLNLTPTPIRRSIHLLHLLHLCIKVSA